MKKIFIIISVLLLALTACGSSDYTDVIDDVEDYIANNEDYEDFENYTVGDYNSNVIASKNELLEYLDIDAKIYKMYNIWLVNYDDDEYLEMDIIEYEGDIDEFISEYQSNSPYCIVDDIAIVDFNEAIEDMCDDLDGKYYD